MYQIAQQVQLTLFPPTYFDLAIAGRVGEITPTLLFRIESCY